MDKEQWEARRDKWKSCLLSIPVSILDSNSETEPDRVWVTAFNRRQSVRQEHESLARTAMQTALEIDQFRQICESQPGCKGRLQASQLADEFVKLGLASVQGGIRKDGEDDGRLTANLITQALAVKKGVLSSPRAVEILLEMETAYGTRSPFQQMSRLHVASTKPSSPQMREWVLESLWDLLQQDALQPGDISKSLLSGDKHHVGLVAVYEMKKKAPLLSLWIYLAFFPSLVLYRRNAFARCWTISLTSSCPRAECQKQIGSFSKTKLRGMTLTEPTPATVTAPGWRACTSRPLTPSISWRCGGSSSFVLTLHLISIYFNHTYYIYICSYLM